MNSLTAIADGLPPRIRQHPAARQRLARCTLLCGNDWRLRRSSKYSGSVGVTSGSVGVTLPMTRMSGNVMAIHDGFVGTIGKTPLIRLGKLSAETGCEILGKAEFLNPGGSVKDRAALYIIQDAERRGVLRPGGTVVEGTAGNTGIGLAHICAARGYRCVIVIPETQSREKMDLLRMLGAEVRPVPAVPYKDPNNYQKIAGRLAQEIENAIWANQFDNVVNRQAHYETTGPEIWRDTGGKADAFVSAVGTGGTLAGTARFLKEKNPK